MAGMQKIKILILAIFVFAIIWSQSRILFEVDANKCIGCRQCEAVCPTDAITIVNGKAVIDPDKCIGCGKCVDVCPVNAISKYAIQPSKSGKNQISDTAKIKADTVENRKPSRKAIDTISTSNSVKPDVKTEIDSSDTISTKSLSDSIAVIDVKKCIGCGVCVQACPENAISIENGKAVIDPEKCNFCGKCIASCPFKAIRAVKRDNRK